jgi:phenylalanyl-tRNA synthetase beta chain
VGDGRRSLAFSLRLQAPDRTLTDDEVQAVRQAVIAAVEQAHDAKLR